MRFTASSLRRLAARTTSLVFLFFIGSALAQSSFPPAPAMRIAMNPVTNKVYIANESANTVTVLNAANGTTATIAVGPQPLFIAVNPATNRVYVNNAGDTTISVIDGDTDTNLTPGTSALAVGTVGPIAINPVTNVIYIVRLSGTGSDEVTFLNGATNVWYTIATDSFQPIAVAVNPVTDRIYVAHYATGDVRIISGAYSGIDFPATVSRGMWSHPFALAVNPVTNKVYVITEDARGPIGILDGATNDVAFPAPASGHAVGPKSIAVNPVTNRIYAAFSNEVIVIDGATNAYTYIPVDTGSGVVGLAVDHSANRIYVAADSGTLTIIDGDTNTTTTRAIAAGATGLALNPVTHKAYLSGPTTTVVDGGAGTAHAIPLAASITPLPGDAAASNQTFTLNASNGFSPNALAVRAVYYQLDSTAGAWTKASGSGPYTASFTGLAAGGHVLYAFAADGQDAPAANGPQSSPLVGAVASYAFSVSRSPAMVSLASSKNPSTSGESVTFTASVSGSAATPSGTVQFLDGSTSLAGCASVALGGGAATCATAALSAGTHSITARYSGDAIYGAATSSVVSQTVNAAKVTPTVALSSSANPSSAGSNVTFTATISGSAGTPSGTVAFSDGATTIAGCGAVTLVSGMAACTTSTLAQGTHTITAAYSGDGSYGSAASSGLSQTVSAPPPTDEPKAVLSANAVNFGGASMGTTSLPQRLVLSNNGTGTLSVTGIATSSSEFAVAHDCGALAAGASCTITITFDPAPSGGALNSTRAVNGTLSVASNSVNGTATATLSGVAQKSLVTHYYESVLGREPDAAGLDFWQQEAARAVALGIDVNEAWFAMAANFFASAEYASFGHTDAQFVDDLYQTFFNRAADAAGRDFWLQQIAAGMPRPVVLTSFMFSPEFTGFSRAIFGDATARPEVDMVGDFYRGSFARLPDSAGFDYWVGQFRAAQCRDSNAVFAAVDGISGAFLGSAEYAARGRTNAQFVGDLYNAFLRRGADTDGVRYWIDLLDRGGATREQLRHEFMSSREFNARAAAVAQAGCTQ